MLPMQLVLALQLSLPVQFIETTVHTVVAIEQGYPIVAPLFMPVSRSVYKRCVCEECIKTGNCADDGTPKGVLIAERLMAAHLQRTRRTQVERAALAHTAANDGADLMASQLRALTLTDHESPVASHVHPEHPNPAPPVSIPALADDLERLTLDPFVAQEPSVATAGRCDVSREIRHRPTVKALTVLDNVNFRVQRCFRLLLAGNFDNVSRELPLLRKAVENVVTSNIGHVAPLSFSLHPRLHLPPACPPLPLIH
ncbi:hypothetical protein EV424DRAFT_1537002 [Suillus variegatus]|nr:hypothetical protein EV424DRAFT_1537002 [Suillus variegatus]